MKWLGSVVAFAWLCATGFGQETGAGPSSTIPLVPATQPGLAVPLDSSAPVLFPDGGAAESPSGRFTSNRNFSNFIGFLSNPLQNIDPRALTQIWPVFLGNWVRPIPALPSGNLQLYGAGLNVALSDRLSFGLNQGGYAMADFNGNQPGLFRDSLGVLRDRRGFAGQRDGWLNLGGFVQYTLIQDVPNQFLLTAGLRLEVPSGSAAIFQGYGPVHMAPYLTFGKEFGKFHVLGTGGYQFPTASGDATSYLFYANLHLDRQMFGWLYPLVELNWIYHTTGVSLDLPTQRGFIDLGNFEATGNILTLAAGANAVLVRDRLELGAVYSTPLATQRNFDFNGLLVKMVVRY
jgi:hypothetical protein